MRTDTMMRPTRQPTTAPRTGHGWVNSARAELTRLRKWPAAWVLLGVWLLLNLTFGYVFDYISYATGQTTFSTEGRAVDSLLAGLLPEAVPSLLTAGMPMFGGAIMLVLGALSAGSGYAWGTWKTVMTQGPSRTAAFGGTLVALAVTVVVAVVATVAVDLSAATLIAAVEGQPLALPDPIELAQAVGGALLIFGMWTAAGVLVGVVTRNPALAIGLGLVWTMAVENLLRAVANVLGGLAYVTDHLPGSAAGSVAGALGATGGTEGAPGVLTVLDGPLAVTLTAGYLGAFVAGALVLIRRRDLA